MIILFAMQQCRQGYHYEQIGRTTYYVKKRCDLAWQKKKTNIRKANTPNLDPGFLRACCGSYKKIILKCIHNIISWYLVILIFATSAFFASPMFSVWDAIWIRGTIWLNIKMCLGQSHLSDLCQGKAWSCWWYHSFLAPEIIFTLHVMADRMVCNLSFRYVQN